MVDIPNSMTVLHVLLPVSLILADRKITGVFNFCNPGAISHNECLDLYKKHIDPNYTYTNFTVEEQGIKLIVLLMSLLVTSAKVIVARRSNNTMDHTKLAAALPDIKIPEIHEAMEQCMIRMRANLEKEG